MGRYESTLYHIPLHKRLKDVCSLSRKWLQSDFEKKQSLVASRGRFLNFFADIFNFPLWNDAKKMSNMEFFAEVRCKSTFLVRKLLIALLIVCIEQCWT